MNAHQRRLLRRCYDRAERTLIIGKAEDLPPARLSASVRVLVRPWSLPRGFNHRQPTPRRPRCVLCDAPSHVIHLDVPLCRPCWTKDAPF